MSTPPTTKSTPSINMDTATVESFGDEWSKFNQSDLTVNELKLIFKGYFGIFPWDSLPKDAEGFDMGCGSGRWAKLVAPRVHKLNCIDPSKKALDVARSTLSKNNNCQFINSVADSNISLIEGSQDFGYSLGVLHHIPNTESALKACTQLLKPDAPFLLYLYYRFDNRPFWFRLLWKASETIRLVVSKLPAWLKPVVTNTIAALIYWPFARLALFGEKLGINVSNLPLSFYRNSSFYTMRTDSRDRFGTPLEQRFTRQEISEMMKRAGLENIQFSDEEPYWVAMGRKIK